jgi:hypothetical protein
MNRYIMIRRLRAPAFLLLIGVLALLAQAHILGWSKSWPLFLILAGVLVLAERAAMAAVGSYPPYPGPIDPRTATGVAPYPGQPTPIIPDHPQDLGKDPFERKS